MSYEATDKDVEDMRKVLPSTVAKIEQAERCATVERIRAAVALLPDTWTQFTEQGRVYLVPQADLFAILAEEAAR